MYSPYAVRCNNLQKPKSDFSKTRTRICKGEPEPWFPRKIAGGSRGHLISQPSRSHIPVIHKDKSAFRNHETLDSAHSIRKHSHRAVIAKGKEIISMSFYFSKPGKLSDHSKKIRHLQQA